MSDGVLDYERAEALGVSREAYDEVLDIVGRQPTVDELSTLLAMWESNGKQQSLCRWLRGLPHAVERDDYLYSGAADHKAVKEPRVQECLDIARKVCSGLCFDKRADVLATGLLLYMVGNVSTEFSGSEYARRCLHMVEVPMAADGHEEDCSYIEMILGALDAQGGFPHWKVAGGGLFGSLLQAVQPRGYDILAPREVRLDAFLFGEEAGRYLVAVEEVSDDYFLQKMGEARLNCCFLGRTTKNRIVVDGYDFGAVECYTLSTDLFKERYCL